MTSCTFPRLTLAFMKLARKLGLNLNYLGMPITAFRRGEPLRLPPPSTVRAETDAAPDAALFDLYREWLAILPVLNVAGVDMDSPEWNAGFDRLREIEDQVAATPPRSLPGYAVKIVMADDRGSMNESAAQLALVAEALGMIESLGGPAVRPVPQPSAAGGPAPQDDEDGEPAGDLRPWAQTDLAVSDVRGVMDALLSLSYSVGSISISNPHERRQRNGLCAVVEAMETTVSALIKAFEADLSRARGR